MVRRIKDKLVDFVAACCMGLLINLDDIIDTIVTVVVTFVVALVVTRFVVAPVRVDGTSMNPTLLNGSIGFSNIISYRINSVDRFDIVVARVDEKGINIVKRVIGMPNETISFVNDTLYINSTPIDQYFLDEDYTKAEALKSYLGQFTNDFTVTLGEDEYFLMGDNRIVSQDSRYYGPFHLDEITSKDIFIIYPFDRFGLAE